MQLNELRTSWEEMASIDPFWAVVSWDKFRAGQHQDQFFALGEQEISGVITEAQKLGFKPKGSALDFGCGLGRLTRPLRKFFDTVYGLDISAAMIQQAQELTPTCTFIQSTEPNISLFPSESLDFIYCNVVLQHQPSPETALGYIREFHRVLKPGGMAVFQAPCYLSLRVKLQCRRRAYALLRRLGVPAKFVYRLGLNPIRMVAIQREQVANIFDIMRCEVDEGGHGSGIVSCTYYCSRS